MKSTVTVPCKSLRVLNHDRKTSEVRDSGSMRFNYRTRHLLLENYAAVIPDNGNRFPDNGHIDFKKRDGIIKDLS